MKNNQPPQAAHHANLDSAAPRQHPLICTGANRIHQVHGQPMSRAPESMLQQDHISTIFPPEIVIENRVCVWLSEESVWSVVGGRRLEAPVCDDKFNGVEHIQ